MTSDPSRNHEKRPLVVLALFQRGRTCDQAVSALTAKKLGDEAVRSRREQGLETHVDSEGVGVRVSRRRNVEDEVVGHTHLRVLRRDERVSRDLRMVDPDHPPSPAPVGVGRGEGDQAIRRAVLGPVSSGVRPGERDRGAANGDGLWIGECH